MGETARPAAPPIGYRGPLLDGESLALGVAYQGALQRVQGARKGGLAADCIGQVVLELSIDVILERAPLETKVDVAGGIGKDTIDLLAAVERLRRVKAGALQHSLGDREEELLAGQLAGGVEVVVQPDGELGRF